MSVLGTCDKTQYEHCGPHEEIHETGQVLPPFPCENWHPTQWAENRGETTQVGDTTWLNLGRVESSQ